MIILFAWLQINSKRYVLPGTEIPNAQTPRQQRCPFALIGCKAEIDIILDRLAALSAEHFNCVPDEVTWADVGTLGSYLQRLREVSDAAFHEGEYAV